jgi:putative two-component system response regulator
MTVLRVLLIEDSLDDELLIVRELNKAGYDVIHKRVESEAELRLSLEHENWDIVICDFVLPILTPFRAWELANSLSRDIPFVIVSGLVDEEKAIDVLKKGAHDFISKSHLSRLPLTVKREIRQAAQRLQDRIKLDQLVVKTIEAWGRALELRDIDTEGHTIRVTDLAVKLAKQMGIRNSHLENIYRGSLLHDIGKMGIPDSILLKPGLLTENEKSIMQLHPKFAYDLIKPIGLPEGVLEIPYSHHERWDGSGYPQGLKGEDIPLSARIFSVVDVYDALTSDRPYRLRRYTHLEAMNYIEDMRKIMFDPKIVDEFFTLMR